MVNPSRLWACRLDREIFEATVFIAFRLAFATVNDALGAQPDPQMASKLPEEVRSAIRYGRPVSPIAT